MQIIVSDPTQLNVVKAILQGHNIAVDSSLPVVSSGAATSVVVNLEGKS
jgi:hypothetical protein